MARYIFIDRASGYIWGDSADIDGRIATGTPLEIAKMLDTALGEFLGGDYYETFHSDPERTYDVYRADIDGSEKVGIIHDGTDQDMINAVKRDCAYVFSIKRDTVDE